MIENAKAVSMIDKAEIAKAGIFTHRKTIRHISEDNDT